MLTGLGDSIIKGVVLNHDSRLTGMRRYQVSSETILDRCGSLLHTNVVNLGKFGCTAPQGARIAESNIERLRDSKYVLLEYGGNDSDYRWADIARDPKAEHRPLTELKDYIASYHTIITRVVAAGAIPVMLSLPPMDADRYFRFFSDGWGDMEREHVMEWLGGSTTHISNGHELYNMTAFKIAREEGVRIIDITSDFLSERNYSQYLCNDGIHPNESGQARIADIIVRELA